MKILALLGLAVVLTIVAASVAASLHVQSVRRAEIADHFAFEERQSRERIEASEERLVTEIARQESDRKREDEHYTQSVSLAYEKAAQDTEKKLQARRQKYLDDQQANPSMTDDQRRELKARYDADKLAIELGHR